MNNIELNVFGIWGRIYIFNNKGLVEYLDITSYFTSIYISAFEL